MCRKKRVDRVDRVYIAAAPFEALAKAVRVTPRTAV